MVEPESDFKYIVRIADTNLDGNKTVKSALTGIKGIGNRIADSISDTIGVPINEKIGNLTDEQIEILKVNVLKISETLPVWMLNRRKDMDTGKDIHIFAHEIPTYLRDDVNRLKKIRAYRGLRHEAGKKVRGQKTRSNGRTGLTIGVQKRKVKG